MLFLRAHSRGQPGFMAKKQLYKVIFYNKDKIYEVFARQIYQSELYGFIEIEEIVFGERNQLVVDPNEEKLKTEFESVVRSYVPLHSVVRIDEVEKEGVAKISDTTGQSKSSPVPVIPFPPKSQEWWVKFLQSFCTKAYFILFFHPVYNAPPS